ncbi:hypothetical protein C0Q70_11274 [Pomacea canaliculata]|uniref:Retrotransposon gag domain-containing protein n=1 Tax=Pomacea canaliculata TaxID=400727 RepID=A0A2T7P5J4_POMCA|nr:hypothetical protein C0Q70_11274 [Pomacea canaliculata]
MAEEGDSPVEALRTYQLLRLEKFAGGPTPNVEEFQREVSWALTMNPMPPNAACGYILNALEGPARRRVLMLPHDAVDTPKKILDVLVEAYGERKDVIDVIASFYNRRQRREESVDEYAMTLRNLQAKANSLQSGAISNIHLAAQLVKGLKNCHVRRETSRHLADNEMVKDSALSQTAFTGEEEDGAASKRQRLTTSRRTAAQPVRKN